MSGIIGGKDSYGMRTHIEARGDEMMKQSSQCWFGKMMAVVMMAGFGIFAGVVEEAVAAEGGDTGNMVFFRGGGAFGSDRSNEAFTDAFGAAGLNDGENGYYVGAGLDLVLSKNLWGMVNSTWALGEIGVEYQKPGKWCARNW